METLFLTQGTNVFMYNSKGNIVNGFKYTKAEANVLFAPRHFRIGRRDYLVFQLENGKLMILSREGKIRVPVKENISFSENEAMLYKNKFTLTETVAIFHDPPTHRKYHFYYFIYHHL